jgi:cupin superfamily acireductone dioxygenase involved in methionine salvage
MRRFRKEGSDKRGTVWSFRINENPLEEFIIQFTKKGCYRGGDIHSKRQYNLLLKGKGIFYKRIGSKDIQVPISEGQLIIIEGNIPHIFKSLTDSWMIEFHELPRTRKIFEEYRNWIEEK